MKNYEKYKDQIIELIAKGNRIGLLNGEIVNCDSIHCDHCGFNEIGNCYNARRDWLNAEYIEKLKLTQREWHLCKAIETGWIARDKDNRLFAFIIKPKKGAAMWLNGNDVVTICDFMPNSFEFIQWRDHEPWSVEELLKLEVEE